MNNSVQVFSKLNNLHRKGKKKKLNPLEDTQNFDARTGCWLES